MEGLELEMEWKDLSNDAKGVLEWVENPYTGKREDISIEVGGYFRPMNSVDIEITKELFDEILTWVNNDKELEYTLDGEKMTFRIRDDSDLVLH